MKTDELCRWANGLWNKDLGGSFRFGLSIRRRCLQFASKSALVPRPRLKEKHECKLLLYNRLQLVLSLD